jgi:hypothetical protein
MIRKRQCVRRRTSICCAAVGIRGVPPLLGPGGRVRPTIDKKLVEDQIFGASGDVASNAIEVYVHRLCKQLAECGAKVQIHTIRGVGYLIAEDK